MSKKSQKIKFSRCPDNPIIPRKTGTWRENYTGGVSLVKKNDIYFFYCRGAYGNPFHDCMGVFTISRDSFNGIDWDDFSDNPIIDIGASGSFDDTHILDPAAIVSDKKVYLYYRAQGHDLNGREISTIGLAISEDGFNFRKHPQPVLGSFHYQVGGPSIIQKGARFYLFVGRIVASDPAKTWDKSSRIVIDLAISDDLIHFTPYELNPVISWGEAGSFDSYSVTTPQVFEEDNRYFMTYCGSDDELDGPHHVGLAISDDLLHWSKYKDNPIFSHGKKGTWDSDYLWAAHIAKIHDIYYMWYAGASKEDRWGKGGDQVGLATLQMNHVIIVE